MNSADKARTALQMRSLIRSCGELELSLVRVPVPQPKGNQVLVRIEAAPLNPSDFAVMFGPADMSRATFSGTAETPLVKAPVRQSALRHLAARLDKALPVGNEGAGTVLEAGESPEAQLLLGRRVALFAGAMYGQYRCVPADQCLLLPEDANAVDGASSFVNPLTALGMIETMRREGHRALVHTAAASNLGRMLNRTCLQDGIGLVNVVRRHQQAELLHSEGAVHVCCAESQDFLDELTEAIAVTGATLAFDAIGGGKLAGQILSSMESALNRQATSYSPYGSSTHKQIYIYGALDLGPTSFTRNFGMHWGMGGWLLPTFLDKAGPATVAALKARVAYELRTTFASRYTGEVSLAGALQPESIARYNKQATGEKMLIRPDTGL